MKPIVVYLLMVKEFINSKHKISEIVATPLAQRNISRDWTEDHMKKTELNGYVYDFSVGYVAIAVDDIFEFHNNLMIKNKIVK